jgi:hypothetical protein
MLWIMPAEFLARSFSETRLQPSLKDCEPCAAQVPDDPDMFKLLEMHFKDSTLNLVGANSPAQLASRPVRYLFADEIDKLPAHDDPGRAMDGNEPERTGGSAFLPLERPLFPVAKLGQHCPRISGSEGFPFRPSKLHEQRIGGTVEDHRRGSDSGSPLP